MLKRTPLFELHRKCNAKLVDFSGWEMPLHYGSQLEEHHIVRRDAGMFDVSHMLVIDLLGADAKEFLLRLLANSVARLVRPGKALYTCMLNFRGGIIDDLIAYHITEGVYRLVVNAGTAEKDLEWISCQRDESRLKVDVIARRDLAMIAVQGPNARERFWQANPAARKDSENLGRFSAAVAADWMIARTGYTGEDGFEICLPEGQAEQLWQALLVAGVKSVGLGARDTLRLEAGMNLYGQDMDESVTPIESGLQWTVDLGDSRDFVGREAISVLQPTRKLVGLVLRERGVLRAHQKVNTAHGTGEVTSGTFSPTLGLSIAFARLPVAVGLGEDVSVEVRGRHVAAKTVKYPFVRHGHSLIDDQLA
jgi:aminomethyltransferase